MTTMLGAVTNTENHPRKTMPGLTADHHALGGAICYLVGLVPADENGYALHWQALEPRSKMTPFL